MRRSLLSNFHAVWVDNLNGDKYRTGKIIPKGLPGLEPETTAPLRPKWTRAAFSPEQPL
jgi:hypothetical protein